MSRANPLLILKYQAEEIKKLQNINWRLEVENSRLTNRINELENEIEALRKYANRLKAKVRRYEGT